MPLVNQNVTSSKSFCLVIVHEVHYARWSFHFLQDHISRIHQIWIQSITLFYDNINLVIHILNSSWINSYNILLYLDLFRALYSILFHSLSHSLFGLYYFKLIKNSSSFQTHSSVQMAWRNNILHQMRSLSTLELKLFLLLSTDRSANTWPPVINQDLINIPMHAQIKICKIEF